MLVTVFGTSARAGCVEFRETGAGAAILVNHCSADMNVGYLVASEGSALNGSEHLFRLTLSADNSKVLWSRGGGPVSGRYQIKVYSCMAPTSLMYQAGTRPSCQVDYASEG